MSLSLMSLSLSLMSLSLLMFCKQMWNCASVRARIERDHQSPNQHQLSENSSCRSSSTQSRILILTALPAQISASNFHDLTQITLCGHKSNLYMPSKWLIIVFQRGPRDPPYTSSSSSLVRVWWQMSQWPQLAQGSHSSPQPSSVTCKAMQGVVKGGSR